MNALHAPRPRAARHAFSLLELTLVLVILGLLMAGAALSLGGFGSRAKARITRNNLTVIKQAIDAYHLEKSQYPVTLQVLLSGKYLDSTKSITDGWEQDVIYAVPGLAGQPYDLFSIGEDGRTPSEDDIDVWTMNQ